MTAYTTPPDDPGQGRRWFCELTCAAAALSMLPSVLSAQVVAPAGPDEPKFTTQDTKADFSPGTVKDYRKQGGFYLIADASGIYAVTAICTHLGCKVRYENQGFHCPCHDSEYDLQGLVTHGPAKFPLKHLEVTELKRGGPLEVDRARTVDLHARF